MSEFTYPSREGLIFSAVLVALYGLRVQFELEAASLGMPDPRQSADYLECIRIQRELESGRGLTVTTTHRGIMDRMAHTRQTLRVSREEWAVVVPLAGA